MKRIKVAICGYGGLGRSHANQLAAMPDVELVAVCDRLPERLVAKEVATNLGGAGPAFDIRRSRTYTDFDELLAKEKPEAVFTALPTDLHAPLAVKAMAAGAHVFSEKPMAIDSAACDAMIQASERYGRKLMVGQCLRFWPEYEFLQKCVVEGSYGRLRSLAMTRVGAYASWSAEDWMNRASRSGGAILDLHLHDVDWAQQAFGEPGELCAGGKVGKTGGIDDVSAVWTYDDFCVTLRGSWMAQGFAMSFQACFEVATLQFGLHPDPALHLVKPGAAPEKIAVSAQSAYFREDRYFLDCIREDRPVERCLPESAKRSVALVERERRAIEAGRDLEAVPKANRGRA
ncbi:MAG: Gfo/Idh/MocA family oxidoreductase [Spirochaetes bacterium]|nr:Gfo/Idh/MocA family oxidoreductase [Spirochaetota bacterium]